MGRLKRMFSVIIILFLSSTMVYAEGNKDIEIFDINQERVVKIIKPNEEVEGIVLNYLQESDGFVAKCDPIPTEGYAIRVPLRSSVIMHNRWVNGTVSEIIVMVSGKDLEPFLVVFEDGDRFLCLSFKGNPDKLSKALDFQLTAFQ